MPDYFRRRFTIIDHEDGNAVDVAKLWVLNPAKNPADLAAMIELAKNVPPDIAAQLREHIDMLTNTPEGKNRTLGDFGQRCLPHVTHPDVLEFAKERLAKAGEL